jgi:hypothetical protein
MTNIMKNICCLLFAAVLVAGCRTPRAPANPNVNARARTVLTYFQSLEARPDKRLLSGQFSNFGNRADLNLLTEIHDQTGQWPAILGVDYAGRGGVSTEAPNRAAIEYWEDGGLVTVSTHLYMAFKNPFQKQTQGVQLLQRSLARGRLGHAYLFAGDQLEELESLARTLAKTLNCQKPVKTGGVATDCCDECPSCRKIDKRNPRRHPLGAAGIQIARRHH